MDYEFFSDEDETPPDPWDPAYQGATPPVEDELPFLASLSTACTLIDKLDKGAILSQLELTYLKHFYTSNAVQEFFCRIGNSMADIPQCWGTGVPPTPETCHRCLADHIMNRVPSHFGDDSEGKKKTPVGLFPKQLKDKLTYQWSVVTPENKDQAVLLGDRVKGIPATLPFNVNYQRVFQGCMLEFASSGTPCKNTCTCPAMGYIDANSGIAIGDSGKVTVRLSKEQISTFSKKINTGVVSDDH